VLENETEDVLWYVDHALEEMVAIVRGLGNELANDKPALPGANSPFAIVTHCLGVMEGWAGETIGGRAVTRDRDAEFAASGSVDALVAQVAAARARFVADLDSLDARAPLRGAPRTGLSAYPYGRTQGGVVLHVFEELYQHLGQLEITRDLLVAVAGQATQ